MRLAAIPGRKQITSAVRRPAQWPMDVIAKRDAQPNAAAMVEVCLTCIIKLKTIYIVI